MNREKVFALAIATINDVIPHLASHQIVGTDNLSNLGANSIERTEIITCIVEELELDISRVELSKANTIDELVDLIVKQA